VPGLGASLLREPAGFWFPLYPKPFFQLTLPSVMPELTAFEAQHSHSGLMGPAHPTCCAAQSWSLCDSRCPQRQARAYVMCRISEYCW